MIIGSGSLLPLDVEDGLGPLPSQLARQCVQSAGPVLDDFMHLLAHLLLGGQLPKTSDCFFPILCFTFHGWLLFCFCLAAWLSTTPGATLQFSTKFRICSREGEIVVAVGWEAVVGELALVCECRALGKERISDREKA